MFYYYVDVNKEFRFNIKNKKNVYLELILATDHKHDLMFKW